MFLINHYDLHRLILMGPNRSPSLTIFIPCLPLNFWVVPAIAYVVLGIKRHIIHDHTFIINLLFIVHDKIIMLIRTWSTTTWENSATTRVV
jgi:hypothetical protein